MGKLSPIVFKVAQKLFLLELNDKLKKSEDDAASYLIDFF